MAATELAPGVSLGDGRYRLRKMLGTGGMASVWLGDDTRLRRPVAIKVLSDSLALDADYVTRFEREALVAARLSHPNLVNIFDFSAGAAASAATSPAAPCPAGAGSLSTRST